MISILMPIYNGIEFIHESVPSIINQTFNKWELIIGINGHPINSKEYNIAKKYESLDKRIRVLELFPVKGKANSLNKMISFCNFSYIALLDVDDIWHCKKLEIQSKFINNYDVVGTNCVLFGDCNLVVPKIPKYDFSNFNFAQVNPIINSSSIIKKELCFWNENGIEDYDLWLRLRKLNKKFYNCPEILVKHRIHKESAFNSKGNHNKVKPLLHSHGYYDKQNTHVIKNNANNVQQLITTNLIHYYNLLVIRSKPNVNNVKQINMKLF
jgi:glycosyltransferase involved in cell wall biosynthesis